MKQTFNLILTLALWLTMAQTAWATDETKTFTHSNITAGSTNQLNYEGNLFISATGDATVSKANYNPYYVMLFAPYQQEGTLRFYPRISGKVKSIVFSSAYMGTGEGYMKIGKGSTWTNSFSENDEGNNPWKSFEFTNVDGIQLDNENDYLEIKLYDAIMNGAFFSKGSITITYEPTASTLTHTHNFSYSKNGSTLTATCANDDGMDCSLASDNWQISTTLTPPTFPAYGQYVYHPATLSNIAGFTAETGATAGDITYVNNTTSESLGTSSPHDIGAYTASVTITAGGTGYTLTTSYSVGTFCGINTNYPQFTTDKEGNYALDGETVTLTFTSLYGETLTAVTATGATSGNDITLTSTGANTYTFTMPQEEVNIGATFSAPTVTTSYVDADGIEQTHVATEIDGSQTNLPGGWYVVNNDVALTTKLNFTGDTHLILADGKTLSIDATNDDYAHMIYYGLSCMEGEFGGDYTFHDLTIYGQAEGTGKVTSKHGHPGYGYSCGYNAKNIIINGGVVEATSSGRGICGSNIIINGGQIILAPSYANITSENITLGWRKPSDYIQAYQFINPSAHGNIQIANGKVFTDGTNVYDNTTTTSTLGNLSNVTLRPISGVTLTKVDENLSATIDGTSNVEMSIPADVTVTSVTYNRAFNDGKASTVMLPFDYTCNGNEGGKFYTFVGVEYDDNNHQWVATMKEVGDDANNVTTLTANTPYLFMPSGTALSFPNIPVGGVTLNTTTNDKQTVVGDWTFKGVYAEKTWVAADCGNDYGFAATSGTSTDGVTDVAAGDFVKIAEGAHIKPMRSYLTYTGGGNPWETAGARSLDASESLPQSISVILVDGNGDTTTIGELDTRTGEITFDVWYDLNGRRLNGKPTAKGVYIHNGKKVVFNR